MRLQVLAARGAGAQAEDPSDPHAKSGGAAWSVTVYCRADTVLLSPNADDDRGSYVSCHVPLPPVASPSLTRRLGTRAPASGLARHVCKHGPPAPGARGGGAARIPRPRGTTTALMSSLMRSWM